MMGLARQQRHHDSMIVFDLKCSAGHVFEAWFRDGDTFDRQAAQGEVSCAICGSNSVSKAPMAPRLMSSRERGGEQEREARAKVMSMMRELRAKVERDCDYVGDRFAEEARRIHYGETEKRGIYGETDERQSRELAEEGIEVARIPWVSPDN